MMSRRSGLNLEIIMIPFLKLSLFAAPLSYCENPPSVYSYRTFFPFFLFPLFLFFFTSYPICVLLFECGFLLGMGRGEVE